MGFCSCCSNRIVRKRFWSPEEDAKLRAFMAGTNAHGRACCSWSSVPGLAGLDRCGRSCRQRWLNHLRPGLDFSHFSPHEINIIMQMHALLGNRWSKIAEFLPGRTDNQIKNFCNSCIYRRFLESPQPYYDNASFMKANQGGVLQDTHILLGTIPDVEDEWILNDTA